MSASIVHTGAATAAVVGIALSLLPMPIRLLWNASTSVPTGLYRLSAPHDLAVGDLVAVKPEPQLASFMVERGYVGPDAPLLKHIAALPGHDVCRVGDVISIDGTQMGTALAADRHGRALPSWQGCRRLTHDDVFLMNTAVPDSFDGRYFGPTRVGAVIGKAHPIFITASGDRRSDSTAATP